MDINDIRAAITVASFVAFIGIVWWAYGARRKARFDRAARCSRKTTTYGRPAREA